MDRLGIAFYALVILGVSAANGATAQSGMTQTASELQVTIDSGPHVIDPGSSDELSFDITLILDNIMCDAPGAAIVQFTSHPTGMDATMPNGPIDDLELTIPAGVYASTATSAFEITRTVTYSVTLAQDAPAGGHLMAYKYTADFDGETGCEAVSGPAPATADFETRIRTGEGEGQLAMAGMEHGGMDEGTTEISRDASAPGLLALLVAGAVAALAGVARRGVRRGGDGGPGDEP